VISKSFYERFHVTKPWFVLFFTFITLTAPLTISLASPEVPMMIVKANAAQTLVKQSIPASESAATTKALPQDQTPSAHTVAPAAPAPVGVSTAVKAQAEPASAGVKPSPFNNLYAKAKTYLGVSYLFGGTNPLKGLDCSAFVQLAFGQIGIELPRSTFGQINVGKPVSYEQIQPGDLVFFSSSGPGPSHVGIYIGNGQMINATEPKVQISPTNTAKRRQAFYGARRILP